MQALHGIEGYQAVGRRLAALRQAKSLTQRELCAMMGREQWYVARIETGERRLDILDLADFAKAFGMSTGDLANQLLGDTAERR